MKKIIIIMMLLVFQLETLTSIVYSLKNNLPSNRAILKGLGLLAGTGLSAALYNKYKKNDWKSLLNKIKDLKKIDEKKVFQTSGPTIKYNEPLSKNLGDLGDLDEVEKIDDVVSLPSQKQLPFEQSIGNKTEHPIKKMTPKKNAPVLKNPLNALQEVKQEAKKKKSAGLSKNTLMIGAVGLLTGTSLLLNALNGTPVEQYNSIYNYNKAQLNVFNPFQGGPNYKFTPSLKDSRNQYIENNKEKSLIFLENSQYNYPQSFPSDGPSQLTTTGGYPFSPPTTPAPGQSFIPEFDYVGNKVAPYGYNFNNEPYITSHSNNSNIQQSNASNSITTNSNSSNTFTSAIPKEPEQLATTNNTAKQKLTAAGINYPLTTTTPTPYTFIQKKIENLENEYDLLIEGLKNKSKNLDLKKILKSIKKINQDIQDIVNQNTSYNENNFDYEAKKEIADKLNSIKKTNDTTLSDIAKNHSLNKDINEIINTTNATTITLSVLLGFHCLLFIVYKKEIIKEFKKNGKQLLGLLLIPLGQLLATLSIPFFLFKTLFQIIIDYKTQESEIKEEIILLVQDIQMKAGSKLSKLTPFKKTTSSKNSFRDIYPLISIMEDTNNIINNYKSYLNQLEKKFQNELKKEQEKEQENEQIEIISEIISEIKIEKILIPFFKKKLEAYKKWNTYENDSMKQSKKYILYLEALVNELKVRKKNTTLESKIKELESKIEELESEIKKLRIANINKSIKMIEIRFNKQNERDKQNERANDLIAFLNDRKPIR